MARVAEWILGVKDEVSPSTKTAKASLEDFKGQMDRTRKELAQTNRAMRDLKAGGGEGSEAFKKLQARSTDLQKQLTKATTKYTELGGTFRATTKGTMGAEKATGGLSSTMAGAGSVMSGYATVALAAAVALAAVTAAAIAAGAALLKYALGAANARREEALRLEALTKTRTIFGLVGGDAGEMQSAIDRVADSTGASRSTLEGYARRLQRIGVRGQAMNDALEGAAIQGAALGDEWGNRFVGMAANAALAGGSVRALADDVKARLGDLAERRMLSLDNLTRRWQQTLDDLFRNVDMDGFLQIWSELIKALGQSRITGQALGRMFERLFRPLNAGAEGAAGGVRGAMEKIVLWALRVERKFVDMQITALQVMKDMGISADDLQSGLRTGALVTLETLGTVLKVAAVAALALGAALAAPFVAVGALAFGVKRLGRWITDVFEDLDLRAIGRDMIDGLVESIRAGIDKATRAVTDLADSVVSAVKDTLQIRSPSRVFAGIGAQTAAGFAGGVDGEAPAAARAVSDMAEGSAGAASSAGRTRGARGGSSITIGEITIQTAATDAGGIAADIRAAIADALEGVLIIDGGAPA